MVGKSKTMNYKPQTFSLAKLHCSIKTRGEIMINGRLFRHLEFTRLNYFSTGIAQLENIYPAIKIIQVYEVCC